MSTVERHYTHGRLIHVIPDGLTALGKTPRTVAAAAVLEPEWRAGLPAPTPVSYLQT